jgi:hypothetical protein
MTSSSRTSSCASKDIRDMSSAAKARIIADITRSSSSDKELVDESPQRFEEIFDATKLREIQKRYNEVKFRDDMSHQTDQRTLISLMLQRAEVREEGIAKLPVE